ncbi:HAD hydrolase-like protein [Kitasatospora sp. NBC_01287]|uniref:HAD family hydrolase n=1 Tax=Kitasatospora sp. NBC_01287 TaxID=2903573 RepID=UPI00224E1113|nr:HAD family hydrolase [Kitasatospora sp. NBC_01287]MCX4751250.1 HAD hydrolase-like protein [Kitasatospora sp. NBC_01287]
MHVVWDWNGTVKDDLDDHVQALNATLPALGGTPVDRETYRAKHTVPIPNFYARLLGRTITEQEWISSDNAFLDHLRVQPVRVRAGAVELMAALREAGHTQSLLSLCPHTTLVREVEEAGIGHFFERVEGRTGASGGTKAAPLAAHLDALGLTGQGHRVLLVGDAVDDADAAHANGALAVLHTGGLHHPAKLAAAGHPLTDTLAEAVALGLRLTARSAHPVAA